MQVIWDALTSPPVLLACIPLAMAIALVVAEGMGWVEPSGGNSGCRCGGRHEM